jgi:hypothetical protein
VDVFFWLRAAVEELLTMKTYTGQEKLIAENSVK